MANVYEVPVLQALCLWSDSKHKREIWSLSPLELTIQDFRPFPNFEVHPFPNQNKFKALENFDDPPNHLAVSLVPTLNAA